MWVIASSRSSRVFAVPPSVPEYVAVLHRAAESRGASAGHLSLLGLSAKVHSL